MRNAADDVGQTLLNWAAAFGTVDMVEVSFHLTPASLSLLLSDLSSYLFDLA